MTELVNFTNGPLHNRKIMMYGQRSTWPKRLTITDDAWSTGSVTYDFDTKSGQYLFSHIGDERNAMQISSGDETIGQRVSMRFVGGRLDGQELDVVGQTEQIPNVMHMVIDESGNISAYYILDRDKSCYRFSHYGQPPVGGTENLVKKIPQVPDDL